MDAVILAAGKGSRNKFFNLPKFLWPGPTHEPILNYVLAGLHKLENLDTVHLVINERIAADVQDFFASAAMLNEVNLVIIPDTKSSSETLCKFLEKLTNLPQRLLLSTCDTWLHSSGPPPACGQYFVGYKHADHRNYANILFDDDTVKVKDKQSLPDHADYLSWSGVCCLDAGNLSRIIGLPLEVQQTTELVDIIEWNNMSPVTVEWTETGTDQSYMDLMKDSFIKESEATWIVGNRLIKWRKERDCLTDMHNRRIYLETVTPKTVINGSFLYYDIIPGVTGTRILESVSTIDIFDWVNEHFLKRTIAYSSTAKYLFQTRIIDRMASFKTLVGIPSIKTINNVSITMSWNSILTKPETAELISDSYNTATCHGDLTLDNMVFDGTKLMAIDWRPDFGSDCEVGTAYYDLGKLYASLVVNFSTLRQDVRSVTCVDDHYQIEIDPSLEKEANELLVYFAKKGYKPGLIKTAALLHLYAMAGLHTDSYSIYLFLYATMLLNK